MSDKPGKNTDAWLADEASVSRAYRELNQVQPPKHLDDAILAAARRAAGGLDDNVIRVQRWRKWTMPAALAATAVFAIPLVVRVFNTAPSVELNRSAQTTMAKRSPTETDLTAQELAEQGAAATDAIVPQAGWVIAKPDSADESTLNRLLREKLSQSGAEPSTPLQNESLNDSAATQSAVAMTAEPRSFQYDPPDTSAIAVKERDRKKNTGWSTPDDETGFAEAPEPAPDNATDLNARPAREDLAKLPPDSQRQDRRRMTSLSSSAADDAPDQAGSSIAAANVERKQDIDELQEVVVTANRYHDLWLEPTQWLDDIARLHERGQPDEARRELGTFFSVYPDYTLPAAFPLRPKDALLDKPAVFDNEIVPEATTWLRGIGLMAYRGDIDQARTQLARFVRIYPDYPLPADFPLTRDDARPIEQ